MALNFNYDLISSGIDNFLNNAPSNDGGFLSNIGGLFQEGGFLSKAGDLFSNLAPLIGAYEQKDIQEDTARQSVQDLISGLNTSTYKQALQPYQTAGEQALQRQSQLLGLGDTATRLEQIEQLKQDPIYQQKLRDAQTGLLQNASATGGLRGGNIQRALAELEPTFLDQFMQRELANLSPVVERGFRTGVTTAAAEAERLKSLGEARAAGSLAGGAADQAFLNSLLQNYGISGGGTLDTGGAVDALGSIYGIPGLSDILDSSLALFGTDTQNIVDDSLSLAEKAFSPVKSIGDKIGDVFGF